MANPSIPENPAKAPWYFLGLQELVSYSAFMGGVAIPSIVLIGLGLIPYLDRDPRGVGIWFGGPEGPPALFAGRVLPFDEKASLVWARLMADGTAKGRPRSALDMIIAAVAEANGCVVVTDNEKDFAELKFINPLRA